MWHVRTLLKRVLLLQSKATVQNNMQRLDIDRIKPHTEFKEGGVVLSAWDEYRLD